MAASGSDPDKKAVEAPKAEQKTPEVAGPVVTITPTQTPEPVESDKDQTNTGTPKVQAEEPKKKQKKKEEEEEPKPEDKKEDYGEYQWIIDLMEANQEKRESNLAKARVDLDEANKVLKTLTESKATTEQLENAKKEIKDLEFDIKKYTTGISLIEAVKDAAKGAAKTFKGKWEEGGERVQSLKESIQQFTKDMNDSLDKENPERKKSEPKKDLSKQSFLGALKDLVHVCKETLGTAFDAATKKMPSKLKTKVENFEIPETRPRSQNNDEIELSDLKAPTTPTVEVSQPVVAQTADPEGPAIEMTDLGVRAKKTSETPVASTPDDGVEMTEFKAPTSVGSDHMVKEERTPPQPHVDRVPLPPGKTFDDISKDLIEFKESPDEKGKSQTSSLTAKVVQDDEGVELVEISGARNSVTEFEKLSQLEAKAEAKINGPTPPG